MDFGCVDCGLEGFTYCKSVENFGGQVGILNGTKKSLEWHSGFYLVLALDVWDQICVTHKFDMWNGFCR